MDHSRYFEDQAVENILKDARLAVFDLNGLILSDEPLQIAAVHSVLQRYGARFDEETWTRRFFGRRSSDYFSEIMRERGFSVTPALVKTLVAEKDRIYRALLGQHLHTSIFPGAMAFVRYLHGQGTKPLALATSASREELECAMGVAGLSMLNMF
ncbi:HAD family phosphatase, partial [bacterium]